MHKKYYNRVTSICLCMGLLLAFCSMSSCSNSSVPSRYSSSSVPSRYSSKEDSIKTLNQDSKFKPVDFSAIEDQEYPDESDDYLSLQEALYSFNYARSYMNDAESAYVSCDEFVEAKPVTTTYFGNGSPCDKWIANRDHTLPFHDNTEDYFSGTISPAWEIKMYDDNEAEVVDSFFVNAKTGDIYNDSQSGEYYPSPYVGRSKYAQLYNKELYAGNMTQKDAEAILIKMYEDLWTCQYELKNEFPSYIIHNEKNEFVINWGQKRIDMIKNGKKNLSVPSKPNMDSLEIYQMELADNETVQVKYNVFVSFQNNNGSDYCDKVEGFDIKCDFVFLNDTWLISDIGDFPWVDNKSNQGSLYPPYIQEYYDEYSNLYGTPEGVLTQKSEDGI